MMYCKKCGSEMPDDIKFCGNCGAEMKVPLRKKSGTKAKRRKTSKKKKMFVTIGILLLVLVEIVTIYFAVEYKKAREYENYIKEAEKKEIEEQETAVKYTWVVDPTIEADDIFYPAEHDTASVNEGFLQSESSRAVIQRDGTLGVIGIDGQMLTEFIYEDIDAYGGRYLMTQVQSADNEEVTMDWLEEDGEVAACQDLSVTNSVYYYCCSDRLYNIDDIISSTETKQPDAMFPIRESTEIFNLESAEDWWNAAGNYALYSNGKRINDFVYDECGSYSEGLFAVCQNGKWGYIDEKANIVIPIEYDASWEQFERTIAAYDHSSESRDFCYAASEGYVTLYKDGEWEMRDTTGGLTVPAGVFEKILPVYEGKCWVKQAGKWGVIQLNEDFQSNTEVNE